MLVAGCDKVGDKPFYYTFDNNTDQKMTLKIYQSVDDYNSALNPYMNYTVQAGEKVEIPSNQFLDSREYYADWYNADYTYSNWFNKQHIKGSFSTAFTSSLQHKITQLAVVHDYARVLCMGTGTQSTWEAVDGWNFVNGSIGDTIRWAQMNPFQKYNQFLFKKDFSGHFYYKEQNTGVLTNYEFVLRTPDNGTEAGSTTGKLYIYTANDWDSLGNITYHIWPADSASGGFKVSDTMVVSMGDKGTWTMVKSDNK